MFSPRLVLVPLFAAGLVIAGPAFAGGGAKTQQGFRLQGGGFRLQTKTPANGLGGSPANGLGGNPADSLRIGGTAAPAAGLGGTAGIKKRPTPAATGGSGGNDGFSLSFDSEGGEPRGADAGESGN